MILKYIREHRNSLMAIMCFSFGHVLLRAALASAFWRPWQITDILLLWGAVAFVGLEIMLYKRGYSVWMMGSIAAGSIVLACGSLVPAYEMLSILATFFLIGFFGSSMLTEDKELKSATQQQPDGMYTAAEMAHILSAQAKDHTRTKLDRLHNALALTALVGCGVFFLALLVVPLSKIAVVVTGLVLGLLAVLILLTNLAVRWQLRKK